MLPFDAVNFGAILIATIFQLAVGMVWYSKSVFGMRWMKLTGMTEKKAMASAQQAMIQGVIKTLVTTYLLAVLVELLAPITLQEGIVYGILLWVTLVGSELLNSVIWERRPLELLYINAGHSFTGVMVAICILTYWK